MSSPVMNKAVTVNQNSNPTMSSIAMVNRGQVGVNQNEDVIMSSHSVINNDIIVNKNSSVSSVARVNNVRVSKNQNLNPMNTQVMVNPNSNLFEMQNNIRPIILNQNKNIVYMMDTRGQSVAVGSTHKKPQNLVPSASTSVQLGQNIHLNCPVSNTYNGSTPGVKINQTKIGGKLVKILPKTALQTSIPNLVTTTSKNTYPINCQKKIVRLVPMNRVNPSQFPQPIGKVWPSVNTTHTIQSNASNSFNKNKQMQAVKTVNLGTQTDIHCWIRHNEEFYIRNDHGGTVHYFPLGELNLKKAATTLLHSQAKIPKSTSTFEENQYSTLSIPNQTKQLTMPVLIPYQSPTSSLPNIIPTEPIVSFEPSVTSKSSILETPKDINTITKVFEKIREEIKSSVIPDEDGNIPLHIAVLEEDMRKLKKQCIILSSIGIQHINHVNHSHETALMLAVKVAVTSENYEAVKMLIAEKADQTIMDIDLCTPLHYAIKHGCTPIVKELLAAPDAVQVVEKNSSDGLTPLHLAAIHGHDEIICHLINHGVNVNSKDLKSGRTPFNFAIHNGNLKAAAILKIFKANTKEPDFAGNVPPDTKLPNISLSNNFLTLAESGTTCTLSPQITQNNLVDSSVEHNPFTTSDISPVPVFTTSVATSNNELSLSDNSGHIVEFNPQEIGSKNGSELPIKKVVIKKKQIPSHKSKRKRDKGKNILFIPKNNNSNYPLVTKSDVTLEEIEVINIHGSDVDEGESCGIQEGINNGQLDCNSFIKENNEKSANSANTETITYLDLNSVSGSSKAMELQNTETVTYLDLNSVSGSSKTIKLHDIKQIKFVSNEVVISNKKRKADVMSLNKGVKIKR